MSEEMKNNCCENEETEKKCCCGESSDNQKQEKDDLDYCCDLFSYERPTKDDMQKTKRKSCC